MDVPEMIRKNFLQMYGTVDRGLEGLTPEEFTFQPRPHCNSIGWIVWHVLRVEDWWIHSVLDDVPQIWQRGWADKMGMPAETRYTGAGMSPQELAAFKLPSRDLVTAYGELVRKDTLAFVDRLTAPALDRPVETVLGRTMTVGEIFSHLFCEMNQHAGQISYLRGLQRGYLGRRV